MTDSPQHQITKYLRKDIATRFGSGTAHPRWRSDESLLAEMRRIRLGSLSLTGRLEKRERSRRYCEAVCSVCGESRWILVDNILCGKTTNCRCQTRKYPRGAPVETLGQRYDAMVQRCERWTHRSSRHYKGRGIRVLFPTRQSFIEWALTKWPSETFKGKDFDRINNDGDYCPENLRLVSRSENLKNRRRKKRVRRVRPGFMT